MSDDAQNVNQQIDLMKNINDTGIRVATTVISSLHAILDYTQHGDPAAKELKKYSQHGHLSFALCQPAYVMELSKRLNDANITNMYMKYGKLDNCGCLVFKDKDANAAEKIFDVFRQTQSKSTVLDTISLQNDARDRTRVIRGLDLYEATLFIEHAKDRNIQIAIENPSKNEYAVIFKSSDSTIIDNIKATVAIELTGVAGNALRKQLDYENQEFNRIYNLSQKPDVEVKVAGMDGSILETDRYGCKYVGELGNCYIKRTNPTYYEQVAGLIASLPQRTELSGEDMAEFKNATPEKQKQILIRQDKQRGRPEYSSEELLEIKKLELNKSLYEKKLSLYNPVQEIYNYAYSNNEMRMAEFEQYEKINSEYSYDRVLNKSSLDPSYENLALAMYNGFSDMPYSLTYIELQLQNDLLSGYVNTLDTYESEQQYTAYRNQLEKDTPINNNKEAIDLNFSEDLDDMTSK